MSNFWEGRRTFVTGGAGLVGSWLVKRLVAAGADVICLLRDWEPRSELVVSGNFERVTLVRGSVVDQELLERVLAEYEITTVMHLAAQAIVGVANANPASTFDTNVRGTWSVLEACRRSPGVKQVVVASSDKAYGEQTVLPYDETMHLNGLNPYDLSKSCADMIARCYAHVFGVPVVVTRCGNFYGGGDLNWNRVIPGTIRSIVQGKRPVIRSDGTFIRDYFYVDDGAIAYMLLAEKLGDKPELAGEAFNFSNEIQLTVREIVDRISRRMGSSLVPIVLNEASYEIRNQYLSAAKARRLLDWQPTYTLEAGLDRTIEWYKNYLTR